MSEERNVIADLNLLASRLRSVAKKDIISATVYGYTIPYMQVTPEAFERLSAGQEVSYHRLLRGDEMEAEVVVGDVRIVSIVPSTQGVTTDGN